MNFVNFFVLPKRAYIQDDHVVQSFIYDDLGRLFLYHSQRIIILNTIAIFVFWDVIIFYIYNFVQFAMFFGFPHELCRTTFTFMSDDHKIGKHEDQGHKCSLNVLIYYNGRAFELL